MAPNHKIHAPNYYLRYFEGSESFSSLPYLLVKTDIQDSKISWLLIGRNSTGVGTLIFLNRKLRVKVFKLNVFRWEIPCNVTISIHVGAKRGVTVSTSAFLACHQCYCAGSSLAWGLNLRDLVCGIFWSSSPGERRSVWFLYRRSCTFSHLLCFAGFYSILFYSRQCLFTAGSSHPPKSSLQPSLSFAILVHTAPCCTTMSSLHRRLGLPTDIAPFIFHPVHLMVHPLPFIRAIFWYRKVNVESLHALLR